jgi:hypothetical protein
MGSEFAAAVVSVGLEEYVDQLEKYCERLAQQQILWLARWPVGRTGRWRHAMNSRTLCISPYQWLVTWRRMQLHRRIDTRLSVGNGQLVERG